MPSAERTWAMARPMPRLAPVTIATLPDNWRSIVGASGDEEQTAPDRLLSPSATAGSLDEEDCQDEDCGDAQNDRSGVHPISPARDFEVEFYSIPGAFAPPKNASPPCRGRAATKVAPPAQACSGE